jgi:hypothetical protein
MICPKCQEENTITIWAGLVARPIGTFSLAGAQMKVSAHRTVIAECSSCGLSVMGHLEDPTYADDGVTFAGGHFVADAFPS